MSQSVHTTFLDSIGRPVVTLKYAQLTEANLGVVYVSPNNFLRYCLQL